MGTYYSIYAEVTVALLRCTNSIMTIVCFSSTTERSKSQVDGNNCKIMRLFTVMQTWQSVCKSVNLGAPISGWLSRCGSGSVNPRSV